MRRTLPGTMRPAAISPPRQGQAGQMGVHSDRTRVVSGHGSALHYPLHWLPCDLRYEVVVTVLVQERDLLPFGDGAMSRPGKPTALMRP